MVNDAEYKAYQKKQWEERMAKKYGSVEAGYAEMKRRRSLQKNPGYLNKIGVERRREISKMGVEARRANSNKGSVPKPEEPQKD